jgi:putative copper resistance protein D
VTIALGLIVARFIHYLALSVLFGAALFPLYGIKRSPLHDYPFLPWLRPVLLIAAIATLLSGLSWLVFATAGMSGSLAGVIDRESWSIVIGGTSFGRLWVVRLALAAIVTVLLVPKKQGALRHYVVIAGSLVLLASIGASGHAAENVIHMIADSVHLLAAGLWIGALSALLVLVIVSADSNMEILRMALLRFSGIGTSVVAVLVLSGLVNSWFLIGFDKIDQLFVSRYEQILLLKLVLFGAMLLLAAANRFRLTPRLEAALDSGGAPLDPIRLLSISILTETVLGAAVLAAVAWLGTLEPPAHA